jgi:hypothetical protein
MLKSLYNQRFFIDKPYIPQHWFKPRKDELKNMLSISTKNKEECSKPAKLHIVLDLALGLWTRLERNMILAKK